MALKIEEGKFYKSRGGRIFGPMVKHERSGGWIAPATGPAYWMATGVCFFVRDCDGDLVEEHYDKTNWLEEGKHYRYKNAMKSKCLMVLPYNRAVVQIWRQPKQWDSPDTQEKNYYIADVSVKNTERHFTEISPVYKESSNEE